MVCKNTLFAFQKLDSIYSSDILQLWAFAFFTTPDAVFRRNKYKLCTQLHHQIQLLADSGIFKSNHWWFWFWSRLNLIPPNISFSFKMVWIMGQFVHSISESKWLDGDKLTAQLFFSPGRPLLNIWDTRIKSWNQLLTSVPKYPYTRYTYEQTYAWNMSSWFAVHEMHKSGTMNYRKNKESPPLTLIMPFHISESDPTWAL